MATPSVPLIDVSSLCDGATLEAIDRACREWGFFLVESHGVREATVEALQREMRGFFAQSGETKRRFARTAENPWGFYDRELTKQAVDRKEIFDCGPDDAAGRVVPWPDRLPGFRAALDAFMSECEALSRRLVDAIARCLGSPPGALAPAFQPHHTSFLRLNYYPVPSALDASARGSLGVHPHTDAGALTILSQDDRSGLEVFHRGAWQPIEPRGATLVINIGDIVQVWSNDRYRAALHRVRASEHGPRFSAPYFYNPSYDALYAPLGSTLRHPGEARYRPIRWGEFRDRRAAGDYQDLGKEVQIDDYRIEPPRSPRQVPTKEGFGRESPSD